jgi:hypothetical protein
VEVLIVLGEAASGFGRVLGAPVGAVKQSMAAEY